MSPVRTLEEIVAEARLEKASRRYGRAADLLAEAGRSPEAEANPRRRKALLRQAAACKYLDATASRGDRVSAALSLLTEPGPAPEVASRIKLAKALKGEMAFGPARTLLAEARELTPAATGPYPADSRGGGEAATRTLHLQGRRSAAGRPAGRGVAHPRRNRPAGCPRGGGSANDRRPGDARHRGGRAQGEVEVRRPAPHLERSLYYYDRGYREGRVGDRVGIAADYGYTAINAAFILDLLASLEEDDLGPDDRSIAERRAQAQKIRERDPRDPARGRRRGDQGAMVVCRDARRGGVRAGPVRGGGRTAEDRPRGEPGGGLGVRIHGAATGVPAPVATRRRPGQGAGSAGVLPWIGHESRGGRHPPGRQVRTGALGGRVPRVVVPHRCPCPAGRARRAPPCRGPVVRLGRLHHRGLLLSRSPRSLHEEGPGQHQPPGLRRDCRASRAGVPRGRPDQRPHAHGGKLLRQPADDLEEPLAHGADRRAVRGEYLLPCDG